MREDKKRKAEDVPQADEESRKEGRGKKGSKRRKSEKESRVNTTAESKMVAEKVEEPEKRGLEKLGKHLGSLIGRKRKMRKGK